MDSSLRKFNSNIFFSKINQKDETNNIENNRNLQLFDISSNDEEEQINITNFNFESLFKSFFKTRKFNVDHNKIPIQSDTNELKFKILSEIFANKPDKFNTNVGPDLLKSLNFYIKNKPFKILQCDKNVGSILMTNEDFYSLCNSHLLNNDTYELLDYDPLNITIDSINNELLNLSINNHISKKLLNRLRAASNSKSGNFRILPKIHKDKFGIRPIISSINHPTSNLCEFIDFCLQPLVKNCGSVIKDSQELLQLFEEKKNFGPNVYLYSCDFESLYTNINPKHASDIITEFLSSQNSLGQNEHINIYAFRQILNLIFKYGIFKFENSHFVQKIGLPMGCKCGPSVANFYLYLLEKNWLCLNSMVIYKRFIDDIFIISSIELNVDDLRSQFLYLKLNIVHGKTVIFLDLKISYDFFLNRIITSLYVKPTNCHPYLITSSNHPKHIFDNIPISLFIRIRRICTNYVDYLASSRILFIQLIKKGYDFKKLMGISKQVGLKDRLQLLPYKDNLSKISNSIKEKFFIKFDINCSFLNSCLNNVFYKIKQDSDLLRNKKILIVNYINQNIGATLIHNFKFYCNSKKFFCRKCSTINCKLCNFINDSFCIKFKNICIPIKNDSNCSSIGSVYVIKCKICNLFYIGETKKEVKKRIFEHIYNIGYFKKNVMKSLINFNRCSEVAQHFSDVKHDFLNLQNCFQLFIFKSNLNDCKLRKSTETELIHLFLNLKIPILNKKIPSSKYISSFSFIE